MYIFIDGCSRRCLICPVFVDIEKNQKQKIIKIKTQG